MNPAQELVGACWVGTTWSLSRWMRQGQDNLVADYPWQRRPAIRVLFSRPNRAGTVGRSRVLGHCPSTMRPEQPLLWLWTIPHLNQVLAVYNAFDGPRSRNSPECFRLPQYV